MELDVGAGEQLDADLVQTTLLRDCEEQAVVQAAAEVSQCGRCASEAVRRGAVLVCA